MLPIRRTTLDLCLVPKWRNWQTRVVQVHVLARVWGFESLLRHHSLTISQIGALGFLRPPAACLSVANHPSAETLPDSQIHRGGSRSEPKRTTEVTCQWRRDGIARVRAHRNVAVLPENTAQGRKGSVAEVLELIKS